MSKTKVVYTRTDRRVRSTTPSQHDCPKCDRPLERLLFPDSLQPDNLYGCFNGCKFPDNRYWVVYDSGLLERKS